MSLKVTSRIVSAKWLYNHLNHKDLIVFDATIPKVTKKSTDNLAKKIIKGAQFFDIKNTFSDQNSPYPNTVLNPNKFEKEAQKLGVNKKSCIVVYDDNGIYSSPRVWWMFQLMGFKNVAILNGGLSSWVNLNFPTVKTHVKPDLIGDFEAAFQSNKLSLTNKVLQAVNDKEVCIVDARSKERFFATVPEPRKDLQGGHIPSAVNLPYYDLFTNGLYKNQTELEQLFHQINPNKKEFIFTCGSGITASILALAAEETGFTNYSVYDGSWTEWASTKDLPISKS